MVTEIGQWGYGQKHSAKLNEHTLSMHRPTKQPKIGLPLK